MKYTQKMKINKEQFKLLDQGHKIETPEGTFYQFPYWVKKNGEEDTYELFCRSDLPIPADYKEGRLEENKYIIRKTNGDPIDSSAWYFILRVDKDPHAKVAAIAYANSVIKDNPILSLQLLDKIMSYDPCAKKTSKEWQEIYPYRILDPDGWDRLNYNYSWSEELITWDEFQNRVWISTCTTK